MYNMKHMNIYREKYDCPTVCTLCHQSPWSFQNSVVRIGCVDTSYIHIYIYIYVFGYVYDMYGDLFFKPHDCGKS